VERNTTPRGAGYAAGIDVSGRARAGVYVTIRDTNLHDHNRDQGTSLYFWGCASIDGISEPDGWREGS
jgi:hypothetical protein